MGVSFEQAQSLLSEAIMKRDELPRELATFGQIRMEDGIQ